MNPCSRRPRGIFGNHAGEILNLFDNLQEFNFINRFFKLIKLIFDICALLFNNSINLEKLNPPRGGDEKSPGISGRENPVFS
jgi:hypothetical protein